MSRTELLASLSLVLSSSFCLKEKWKDACHARKAFWVAPGTLSKEQGFEALKESLPKLTVSLVPLPAAG